MGTYENIREQQNKRWSELTEEQKESIFKTYHMLCEYYPNQKMKKWYEDKYGKHNVGMD